MSGQPTLTPISVKRSHGLGNVILLLPLLDKIAAQGTRVQLVTQPQWVSAFQSLRPGFEVTAQAQPDTIDLDNLTASLRPSHYRSEEFASLLDVEGETPPPRLDIPDHWRSPFVQWEGAIGFAPEAGHTSRQWPREYSVVLADALKGSPLVLIGTSTQPELPCDFDFRSSLNLEDLLGLVSVLQLLICMDSGALHLATALGIPAIAIFGGVAPQYRIREEQKVFALQANLACCPCNKVEVCEGRYDCIKAITPEVVLNVVQNWERTPARIIQRI